MKPRQELGRRHTDAFQVSVAEQPSESLLASLRFYQALPWRRIRWVEPALEQWQWLLSSLSCRADVSSTFFNQLFFQ